MTPLRWGDGTLRDPQAPVAADRKTEEIVGLSVGEALIEGADRLQATTDTPRLEAETLLAHTTGLPRTTLLAYPERRLDPTAVHRYRALLDRRAAGYPLPYLTGHVEFYGLDLIVTPSVLIPRPETETLVDLALAHRPRLVVDVGTGSGCIAVALAVHLPETRVYGTDISATALRVAAANARRHRVSNRIHFIQCDLIAPLFGPVDLVVANPPYVAAGEWADLPHSIREHEPHIALDGGPDGLDIIRRLLKSAPRILRPGGALLIEIGATQGQATMDLVHALWPSATSVIHSDLAGRDRVLEVQW